MSDEKPKAKAGWYPHPSMADTQRYWDGAAWTDKIAPAAAPTPAPQKSTSAFTIARGVALGIVVVIALVWFISGLVTADDEMDCLTESSQRVLDGQSPLNCD